MTPCNLQMTEKYHSAENAEDSDGGSASEFGYSVSMTDTYALVGAPGVEINCIISYLHYFVFTCLFQIIISLYRSHSC